MPLPLVFNPSPSTTAVLLAVVSLALLPATAPAASPVAPTGMGVSTWSWALVGVAYTWPPTNGYCEMETTEEGYVEGDLPVVTYSGHALDQSISHQSGPFSLLARHLGHAKVKVGASIRLSASAAVANDLWSFDSSAAAISDSFACADPGAVVEVVTKSVRVLSVDRAAG